MSDRAIEGDYENETGELIVETFKELSYEDIPMVLVACHGPFTWGATTEKAVYHSAVLEELAEDTVIHRLTSDPHPEELVAPTWMLDRNGVRQRLMRAMEEADFRQGSKRNKARSNGNS